jgi:hypothetical protein
MTIAIFDKGAAAFIRKWGVPSCEVLPAAAGPGQPGAAFMENFDSGHVEIALIKIPCLGRRGIPLLAGSFHLREES